MYFWVPYFQATPAIQRQTCWTDSALVGFLLGMPSSPHHPVPAARGKWIWGFHRGTPIAGWFISWENT